MCHLSAQCTQYHLIKDYEKYENRSANATILSAKEIDKFGFKVDAQVQNYSVS